MKILHIIYFLILINLSLSKIETPIFLTFDRAVPVSCDFSSPDKFLFSTFLNPPMITSEILVDNNTTVYYTNNDNSYFTSSTNGNGVTSIMALYPNEYGIFSIHVNSIYNSSHQSFYFVINSQGLEVCDSSPITTSKRGNTYFWVVDNSRRVSTMYQNNKMIVSYQKIMSCRTIFSVGSDIIVLSREGWGLRFNENDGALSLFSTTDFQGACSDGNSLFVYGGREVYLLSTSGKTLKKIPLISFGECCMVACTISTDDNGVKYVFIGLSNFSRNLILAYKFSSFPIFGVYPFLKKEYDFSGKFPDQITSISSVFVRKNFFLLGVGNIGGGDSNMWSRYPQINIFSFDGKEINNFYNETTLGSAISTSCILSEDKKRIHFSFCGEYNNELVPTQGGYVKVYSIDGNNTSP